MGLVYLPTSMAVVYHVGKYTVRPMDGGDGLVQALRNPRGTQDFVEDLSVEFDVHQ